MLASAHLPFSPGAARFSLRPALAALAAQLPANMAMASHLNSAFHPKPDQPESNEQPRVKSGDERDAPRIPLALHPGYLPDKDRFVQVSSLPRLDGSRQAGSRRCLIAR